MTDHHARSKPNVDEGDFVVLYGNHDAIFIIQSVTSGDTLHTKFGSFAHDDLIGVEYGGRVEARTKQHSFRGFLTVCRPTPELLTSSLAHKTQIIYTADIALLMSGLGVAPGKTIIEAGTGSGSLSCAFAYALKNDEAIESAQNGPSPSAPPSSGRLYTFEFNEDRKPNTDRLFESLGLLNRVIFTAQRDVISDGLPAELDGSADGVFLDLPSPWLVVRAARKVLKEGGMICLFSPCIEQVIKNCAALESHGFADLKTYECLLKEWGCKEEKRVVKPIGHFRDLVEEGAINKLSRSSLSYQLPMRGHTSYLTFARKLADDEHLQPKMTLTVQGILQSKEDIL